VALPSVSLQLAVQSEGDGRVVLLALAPLLLLVPSVVAGPATPTATASGIPPVIWEIVSFSEPESAPVTITDPSRSTVQFLPAGRLLARLDCHHGHGGFTAAAGVLALTPLAVTTEMCPPDSEDTRIQTILERATSYTFAPDGLLLLHGDTGSLHLRPALTGVRWAWQTFQGSDDTIVRPDDPSQYTVEFLPNGTLAIQAACHQAVGTYTVDNSTVDLRIGERTRAICPPGALMDRFLRDLDQVTSHVFRDGKLYLALPMDAGIHAFAPTSIAPPAATPAAG
jgi:heat shock protein HslJ